MVNEGREAWNGILDLPGLGACWLYDAWENGWKRADREGTRLRLTLEPLHSLAVVLGEVPEDTRPLPEAFPGKKEVLRDGWKRSVCRAVRYPAFGDRKDVFLPDRLEEEMPEFSGFVRYERTVQLENVPRRAELLLTDAQEGVEVFVNGQSLGIQIAPPFRYELTAFLKAGENDLAVEVATTLERENAGQPDRMRMYVGLGPREPMSRSGLSGEAILKLQEE